MKYTVVTRDFSVKEAAKQFELNEITAPDVNTAWDIVELNVLNSDCQSWILTKEELQALKKILK
jgi:hypothetical protein